MKIFKRKTSFEQNNPESIIAACLQNEPEAQRALISYYYGFAKSICRRFSSDDLSADEILNDSFLKVFNNLHKYNQSQAFKAWLRTIIVNTSIDYYRKSIHETNNISNVRHDIPDETEDVISKISAEEILRLVRSLSPAYRMVFTLFVIEGYSHKEIAEIMGIKEGTSKSNLQDARHKLQAMILKLNPQSSFAYE
jgi:RNA polymerase sigma-70 factor (ECF subfamily)